MRILVLMLSLVAAALSAWAGYLLNAALVGSTDGENVYVALVATILGIVFSAVGVWVSARRRRFWPAWYLWGSFCSLLLSVLVGMWVLAAS